MHKVKKGNGFSNKGSVKDQIPLTNVLPNQSGDGTHTFKQF